MRLLTDCPLLLLTFLFLPQVTSISSLRLLFSTLWISLGILGCGEHLGNWLLARSVSLFLILPFLLLVTSISFFPLLYVILWTSLGVPWYGEHIGNWSLARLLSPFLIPLFSSWPPLSPSFFKNQEKNQVNNLTLHIKQLEKEEMKDPRVSRRKEIIKIRAEINTKETKETIAKINKAKSWFFEKINKINKPLARLIKKGGGESNQQN